ncbi:hypothetical protein MSAN_00110000 [Mycena sanguinolenta]|uniref:F-box domain-containing protein n=1 Tax=Mycena sanguinolenta TaxID=230812 RepID=A0A8H6ZFU1_9AGAR|nr:hypothetical protein MSAN_00110000 [Mycena sanguinolenta]
MDSPFRQHLHTNYAPSEDEIPSIRAYLVPHRDELANLETLIRELCAQRDTLKEHVDAHEALISPARRLPQDIIQEIFLACIPTHRNAVMSTHEAPLLLGHICSGWRSIALSTPMLWNSLHINLTFVLSSDERVSAVEEWLRRASTCLLSLSVWQAEWRDTHASDSPLLTHLMRLLVVSASQWRDIELHHVPYSYLDMLAGVAAPLLEGVRIKSDYIIYPLATMLESPALRRVALLHPDLGDFTQRLGLPWEFLTDLSLVNEDVEVRVAPSSLTFSLIRQCPRLLSLRFQMGRTGDGPPLTGEPVHLPALEWLSIQTPFLADTPALHIILRHLRMPELRKLELPTTLLQDSDAVFLSPLRTSPKVENLQVHLASFTLVSLMATFKLFPGLRELQIYDLRPEWEWPEPETLQYLTAESLLPLLRDLCPGLQDIDIVDTEIPEACVVAFAEKQAPASLRSLHVQFDRFRDASLAVHEQDLQPFVERGLKISLQYLHGGREPTAWEGLLIEQMGR